MTPLTRFARQCSLATSPHWGEVREKRSRDAPAPGFCSRREGCESFRLASGKFRLAPGTHDARSCAHKGSGAPKGAPSNAPRCIDKRCRLPGLRGSAPKMIRGALAFRRFAAALATTSQRRDSAPEPRFLGLGEAPGETHDPEKAYPGLDPGWKPASRKDHAQTMTGVLPALTCPSPVSSSQTGRRAGPAGPRSRTGTAVRYDYAVK